MRSHDYVYLVCAYSLSVRVCVCVGNDGQERIWQAHVNLNDHWRFNDSTGYPAYLTQFFADQMAFVRAGVAQNATSSTYWGYLRLLMAQFDGLVDGYNAFADSDKVRTTPARNNESTTTMGRGGEGFEQLVRSG